MKPAVVGGRGGAGLGSLAWGAEMRSSPMDTAVCKGAPHTRARSARRKRALSPGRRVSTVRRPPLRLAGRGRRVPSTRHVHLLPPPEKGRG